MPNSRDTQRTDDRAPLLSNAGTSRATTVPESNDDDPSKKNDGTRGWSHPDFEFQYAAPLPYKQWTDENGSTWRQDTTTGEVTAHKTTGDKVKQVSSKVSSAAGSIVSASKSK